jgi:biotin carboxylase
MEAKRPIGVLVLSSAFKGDRFIRQCHRRGAKVTLLTTERFLSEPWPRECLDQVFALPVRNPLEHTLNAVSYLARSTRLDVVAPMDDYDVEVAAAVREHLRIPGLGASRARFFRDKLAMRQRAREGGLNVPDFSPVLNYDELREFMARVSPPWMLKPRSEASTSGIKKVEDAEQVWRALDALGDRQSLFLLERYVKGDIFHVDSLVSEGKVVFAEVHRCGAPPFDVTHHGGVWRTRTVARGGDDEQAFRALNQQVLATLGLTRGASHTEFIKGADGRLYFLETSARVGGAFISEMVESATGINLFEEWANLEVDQGLAPYALPPRRAEYGGVITTLARQQFPDLSGYADPEVALRPGKEHHAALVLRAASVERMEELVEGYAARFLQDFMTSAPAREGRD